MSEQVQKAIEERERRTRGEPEPKAAKPRKKSEEYDFSQIEDVDGAARES